MITRAIYSLKKNVGKTVLLFVIMVVVANLVISGLSIQSASIKSMQQIRESLGSDVTLTTNMSAMMANRDKGQAMSSVMSSITEDMANQLKDLDYVENYNYTVSTTVDSETIVAIETETSTNNSMQRPGNEATLTTTSSGDFTISGNTTMAYVSDFMESNYSLVEGRLLDENDANSNYVVISDTLATDNDLTVGSTFTITNNDVVYELEVAGIYEITTSSEFSMMSMRGQNPYNTLYVGIDLAKTINGGSTDLTSAVFYLDDPENIEAFKELATNNTTIDWETYALDANDRAYQSNVSTLENMENFAKIFVIVVVIAGGSILCLILMLTVKNRIYEIGVLVSLGETKLNIIMQQFIEIFVIGVIAFTLSLGSGQMISNVISGMLQDNASSGSQVQMQMPNGDQMPSMDSSATKSSSDKGNMLQQAMKSPTNVELDVSLTGGDIIDLGLITSLICIISTMIPALYILRLSPREILVRKEG